MEIRRFPQFADIIGVVVYLLTGQRQKEIIVAEEKPEEKIVFHPCGQPDHVGCLQCPENVTCVPYATRWMQ